MNTTQIDFQKRRAGETQNHRVLRRLKKSVGKWVSMPVLARAGANKPNGFCMVHSRVSDLREQGFYIEHENRWHKGQCHSFYRLNLGAEEHAA